jgi:hydroxymethylpyrimidine/phosphomethylpyrimidine kinase
MIPIALTIAGSDPSGGAGIQADLKTFHRFHVYGEAAITLITVQNTRSVTRVEMLATDLVQQQVEAVFSDVPPHAVKTGALGSRAMVEAVVEALQLAQHQHSFPLVVDPVMISKHGSPLLAPDAEQALMKQLLPLAYLVTPNLDEAAVMAGFPVTDRDTMLKAAGTIAASGPENVLIKGGHLAGQESFDLLYTRRGEVVEYPAHRIETPHTHGSGCTYSAAITAELARGTALPEAVARAKRFIHEAIRTNPGLGHGAGPLNHWA